MTSGERTAKWRAKHAKPYVEGPLTLDDWDDLRFQPDDVGFEAALDEVEND